VKEKSYMSFMSNIQKCHRYKHDLNVDNIHNASFSS
jgi:hypothetical protein